MERGTTLTTKMAFYPKVPQISWTFIVFEEELNPHYFYQGNQATRSQEGQETQVSCKQLGGLGWDV